MSSLINTQVKPFKATAFHDGEFVQVTEADLKGKWSVVFFYPADFTFVCPTELGDVADLYAQFQSLGVEIYSVSTDTHFTHKAWHDASDTIRRIEYPMVGDPTHAISGNFGVLIEDEGLALRGTFVVNPEGVIKVAEIHDLGIGRDAKELLRKVRAHKPDIAVVDVRMPPTHTDEGLRAAHEIRAELPEVSVLVLSQYVEVAYARELLAESAEGLGYLLKDRVTDVEAFAEAVRRVAEGGSALDPEVVSQMLGRARREDPLAELTPRERQVLGLMAEGRSNAAIAAELVVTDRAVEKHVTNIFAKLDLAAGREDHRRVLAVLRFLDQPG